MMPAPRKATAAVVTHVDADADRPGEDERGDA
jgi:hypothetical protein